MQKQRLTRRRKRTNSVYIYFAAILLACVYTHQGNAETPIPGTNQQKAVVATSGLQPTSEAELRDSIAKSVTDAWRSSDFRWLDATADEYVRTRAKTYSGKWRLSVFYSALSDQLKIDWSDDWYMATTTGCHCKIPDPTRYEEADRRWDIVRVRVDEWVKRNPPSAHAKLALAQMLVNRAWFYRGSGPSDSVPSQAWPRVSRYLAAASDILIASRSIRSADPEWFDIMFFIAAAQSWSQPQIDTLVEDLRKVGQSYTTAYQSAASLLLPKWGGSYEALERFARQALSDFGDDGLEAYTRIYWNAVRADDFTGSQADWPTMKRGFEAIIRKYPDSRNANGLAMYACGAGDAPTFDQTMQRLGANVTPETWSISVNSCTAHYGNEHSTIR